MCKILLHQSHSKYLWIYFTLHIKSLPCCSLIQTSRRSFTSWLSSPFARFVYSTFTLESYSTSSVAFASLHRQALRSWHQISNNGLNSPKWCFVWNPKRNHHDSSGGCAAWHAMLSTIASSNGSSQPSSSSMSVSWLLATMVSLRANSRWRKISIWCAKFKNQFERTLVWTYSLSEYTVFKSWAFFYRCTLNLP